MIPSSRIARSAWAATLLALLAVLGTSLASRAQTHQVTSLREGNRLYREGRLEEAYAAYVAGYDPARPHPVLAYNMATTAHQLDRVAEAILWYRRAAEINPGDPWLQENLAQARAALGLQPYAAPGVSGLLAAHSTAIYLVAGLLAWAGLLLWILRPRRAARAAMTLMVLAASVYIVTVVADRDSPRPAVVVTDCSDTAGDLPAGSEIWIVGETTEGFEVGGPGVTITCPRDTVVPLSDGPDGPLSRPAL